MSEPVNMEWRDAIGFPQYEVSEHGDLRRKSTLTRLKGHLNSDGYPEYSIRNEFGQRVHCPAHRLVAEAFLGPRPSGGHQVAHSDGSRLHCHYSNLRWATSLQNHADRRAHGTGPVGIRNPRAKITEKDVLKIRAKYRQIKKPNSGQRVSDLADEYGLHHATILSIAKGRSWSHVEEPSQCKF